MSSGVFDVFSERGMNFRSLFSFRASYRLIIMLMYLVLFASYRGTEEGGEAMCRI